ncbi:hypothetical protein CNYM01_10765 [Colletotrichum nymphaeae SA-01]|uniref:Uncharacterized protein n=1 Tax=Colletotrichum nymphaeae SA-01 TaxID=1460502 RepID=A0A135SZQ6_9PEZI|nr:hypothetical protein CNYM01_10765 [Colletotrichum nymphaeae SA-01]
MPKAKVSHKYFPGSSHCIPEPMREPGEHPDAEQAPPWVWTWPSGLVNHSPQPSFSARLAARVVLACCSGRSILLSTYSFRTQLLPSRRPVSEVNHLPHPPHPASIATRNLAPAICRFQSLCFLLCFHSMIDFLCQPLPTILNRGRSICGEFFLRLALGDSPGFASLPHLKRTSRITRASPLRHPT